MSDPLNTDNLEDRIEGPDFGITNLSAAGRAASYAGPKETFDVFERIEARNAKHRARCVKVRLEG